MHLNTLLAILSASLAIAAPVADPGKPFDVYQGLQKLDIIVSNCFVNRSLSERLGGVFV